MTQPPPSDPPSSGEVPSGSSAPDSPPDPEISGPGAGSEPPSPEVQPGMLGVQARPWSVELPEFEGPLDLLLHLVRRHELDILEIPISFVCEKYLEYLAFMQAMELEVAGDYLVMAATLAYLKSRELVPHQDAEGEEEQPELEGGPDPREELISRLLEYQKYRQAASDLDRLPVSGRDVFDRGAAIDLPPVDPGLAPLTLFRLAEAYHRVLDRARIHKSHEVVLEQVTVSQRMQQLALMVQERPRFEFESLFLDRTWTSEAELRSMLVVTLMSVLELTKLGVIHVHQPHDSPTIVIERRATAEETREILSAYRPDDELVAAEPAAADNDSEDHA